MSEQKPPKIEFPCDYRIRVVANSVDSFKPTLIEIVRKHAPEFDEASMDERPSKGGKYTAHSFAIIATGEPQLQALFEDLKATGQVHLVL